MRTIRTFSISLWRDQRGQDFVEYVLLCGFAAAAVSCLGAISAVSDRFGAVMQLLMVAITRLSPA